MTLIDSLFTAFNWLQVHHPLPSTLSRLLLIAVYLFHITIYCYLPSHQLLSFSLLSFLPPLCPLYLPVSLLFLLLPLCSPPSWTWFLSWSWWNLCLPQPPVSLPPVFALSVPPPAPPVLSSSQKEERWAGTEHSPGDHKDLSLCLSDAQSWAIPQGLLRRYASHGAPDEGDESEKRQELKVGFPTGQEIRQPASVLWSGSVFNNPLKICTVATSTGTQAAVKVSCRENCKWADVLRVG